MILKICNIKSISSNQKRDMPFIQNRQIGFWVLGFIVDVVGDEHFILIEY